MPSAANVRNHRAGLAAFFLYRDAADERARKLLLDAIARRDAIWIDDFSRTFRNLREYYAGRGADHERIRWLVTQICMEHRCLEYERILGPGITIGEMLADKGLEVKVEAEFRPLSDQDILEELWRRDSKLAEAVETNGGSGKVLLARIKRLREPLLLLGYLGFKSPSKRNK